MPWKETNVLEERIAFVARALGGSESVSALCREFGVSRPTGYRWLRRYGEEGDLRRLTDRSSRPRRSPSQTPAAVEDRVEALRKAYGWGAKKLQVLLREEGVELGVATVHRILRRRGLLEEAAQSQPHVHRFERAAPNELWQMDFKGEWGTKAKCFPLSILDDHSRFTISLTAHPGPRGEEVSRALVNAFQTYGVPKAMLMDHGTPWFSTTNGAGLTYVAVALLKQGIRLCYSGIGHPQTQGKVERFHRSLKADLRRRGYPASGDLGACQAFLDRFRHEYNHVRPHEALDLQRPSQRYRPSERAYRPTPPEWEYPEGAEVRHLNAQGSLDYRRHRYFVCEALANERVRIWPFESGYLVQYRNFFVRQLDPITGTTRPLLTEDTSKAFAQDSPAEKGDALPRRSRPSPPEGEATDGSGGKGLSQNPKPKTKV